MKALRLKSSPLLVHLVIFLFAVSCLALTSCGGSSSAQTRPAGRLQRGGPGCEDNDGRQRSRKI